MLNKCKCGSDAIHIVGELGHSVKCNYCYWGFSGSTAEMAELMWNEQNPVPANPPEDFEARFKTALRGITWFVIAEVLSDDMLAIFKKHFGFDLKQVAREQWAKEHRNDD